MMTRTYDDISEEQLQKARAVAGGSPLFAGGAVRNQPPERYFLFLLALFDNFPFNIYSCRLYLPLHPEANPYGIIKTYSSGTLNVIKVDRLHLAQNPVTVQKSIVVDRRIDPMALEYDEKLNVITPGVSVAQDHLHQGEHDAFARGGVKRERESDSEDFAEFMEWKQWKKARKETKKEDKTAENQPGKDEDKQQFKQEEPQH